MNNDPKSSRLALPLVVSLDAYRRGKADDTVTIREAKLSEGGFTVMTDGSTPLVDWGKTDALGLDPMFERQVPVSRPGDRSQAWPNGTGTRVPSEDDAPNGLLAGVSMRLNAHSRIKMSLSVRIAFVVALLAAICVALLAY